MSNDGISSAASATNGERLEYESPRAEWRDLRIITLGGSPGFDDSGNGEDGEPIGKSGYDERAEDYDNYV